MRGGGGVSQDKDIKGLPRTCYMFKHSFFFFYKCIEAKRKVDKKLKETLILSDFNDHCCHQGFIFEDHHSTPGHY